MDTVQELRKAGKSMFKTEPCDVKEETKEIEMPRKRVSFSRRIEIQEFAELTNTCYSAMQSSSSGSSGGTNHCTQWMQSSLSSGTHTPQNFIAHATTEPNVSEESEMDMSTENNTILNRLANRTMLYSESMDVNDDTMDIDSCQHDDHNVLMNCTLNTSAPVVHDQSSVVDMSCSNMWEESDVLDVNIPIRQQINLPTLEEISSKNISTSSSQQQTLTTSSKITNDMSILLRNSISSRQQVSYQEQSRTQSFDMNLTRRDSSVSPQQMSLPKELETNVAGRVSEALLISSSQTSTESNSNSSLEDMVETTPDVTKNEGIGIGNAEIKETVDEAVAITSQSPDCYPYLSPTLLLRKVEFHHQPQNFWSHMSTNWMPTPLQKDLRVPQSVQVNRKPVNKTPDSVHRPVPWSMQQYPQMRETPGSVHRNSRVRTPASTFREDFETPGVILKRRSARQNLSWPADVSLKDSVLTAGLIANFQMASDLLVESSSLFEQPDQSDGACSSFETFLADVLQSESSQQQTDASILQSTLGQQLLFPFHELEEANTYDVKICNMLIDIAVSFTIRNYLNTCSCKLANDASLKKSSQWTEFLAYYNDMTRLEKLQYKVKNHQLALTCQQLALRSACSDQLEMIPAIKNIEAILNDDLLSMDADYKKKKEKLKFAEIELEDLQVVLEAAPSRLSDLNRVSDLIACKETEIHLKENELRCISTVANQLSTNEDTARCRTLMQDELRDALLESGVSIGASKLYNLLPIDNYMPTSPLIPALCQRLFSSSELSCSSVAGHRYSISCFLGLLHLSVQCRPLSESNSPDLLLPPQLIIQTADFRFTEDNEELPAVCQIAAFACECLRIGHISRFLVGKTLEDADHFLDYVLQPHLLLASQIRAVFLSGYDVNLILPDASTSLETPASIVDFEDTFSDPWRNHRSFFIRAKQFHHLNAQSNILICTNVVKSNWLILLKVTFHVSSLHDLSQRQHTVRIVDCLETTDLPQIERSVKTVAVGPNYIRRCLQQIEVQLSLTTSDGAA